MNRTINPFKTVLLVAALIMPLTLHAASPAGDTSEVQNDIAKITAANITEAIKNLTPEQAASKASEIVKAAILKNPELAVAITKAAILATPRLAVAITTAAVAAVPFQTKDILSAAQAVAPNLARDISDAAHNALIVSRGVDNPPFNNSEPTVNNIELEVAVIVNAINSCHGNQTCSNAVWLEVITTSSNPVLLFFNVEPQVSPN